jgi:hypothetical protein
MSLTTEYLVHVSRGNKGVLVENSASRGRFVCGRSNGGPGRFEGEECPRVVEVVEVVEVTCCAAVRISWLV